MYVLYEGIKFYTSSLSLRAASTASLKTFHLFLYIGLCPKHILFLSHSRTSFLSALASITFFRYHHHHHHHHNASPQFPPPPKNDVSLRRNVNTSTHRSPECLWSYRSCSESKFSIQSHCFVFQVRLWSGDSITPNESAQDFTIRGVHLTGWDRYFPCWFVVVVVAVVV